jgi:Fur family ferric uptake transcriptional regulator
MYPLERFHMYLTRHHRSHTGARDEMYAALGRLGPCTKTDLARDLAGTMDQATVYRTINFFLDIGVAEVVRYRLVEFSDHFKQHHHHFTCSMCDREISFHDDGLERAIERIAAGRQLQLASHQIELTGLCMSCQVQAAAIT